MQISSVLLISEVVSSSTFMLDTGIGRDAAVVLFAVLEMVVALAVVVKVAFVLAVVMPVAIFSTLMALAESESFSVFITCNSKRDH